MAAPAAIDFGDVYPGTVATRALSVANRGDVPVSIGSVGVAGDQASAFAVEADGCGGHTLAPGDGCSLVVRFVSVVAGARSAQRAPHSRRCPGDRRRASAASLVQLTGRRLGGRRTTCRARRVASFKLTKVSGRHKTDQAPALHVAVGSRASDRGAKGRHRRLAQAGHVPRPDRTQGASAAHRSVCHQGRGRAHGRGPDGSCVGHRHAVAPMARGSGQTALDRADDHRRGGADLERDRRRVRAVAHAEARSARPPRRRPRRLRGGDARRPRRVARVA